MKTLCILLRKELLLFRANKFIPILALLYPCVVILVIPLVTTMDVRHIDVSVVCRDNSRLSRDIISDLAASEYFSVTTAADYEAAMEKIEDGTADVILEIPADFQKHLESGAYEMPGISANGVNGTKGALGGRYVAAAVMGSVAKSLGTTIPERVTVTYLYNPELEYRDYMIPALMIMLLIMICGFLPSLNLVQEKETGTIEQMNVTPVKTVTFVLSKMVPFWIIGLLIMAAAMLLAATVYGLVPRGSLASIFIGATLFIFVMSGIGIIIANFSAKLSQSMFLMLFIVLIFVLISGLLTPISSMPSWARYATYALPPRYFVEIMRCVYLKATSIGELWSQFAALAGFAIALNVVAAMTYRKQA